MSTLDTRSNGLERFVGSPPYPFGIAVSQGRVHDMDRANVLAFSDQISQIESVVWPGVDIQPSPDYATVAAPATISSESDDDDAAGAGMQTAFFTGLDGNWDLQEELVAMGGTAGVQTVGSYIRHLDLIGVTAGSPEASNVGRVWVGDGALVAGVPAVRYLAMDAAFGKSMTAVWSSSRGVKAYAVSILVNSGLSGQGEVKTFFTVRPLGGMWTNRGPFILGGGAPLIIPQGVPGEFPQQTDFQLRASSSAGTFDVSLLLEILTRRYYD